MTDPEKSTWEVLRSLGFDRDPQVISDPPGGLSYDFGNLRLSASVCVNLRAQPIVLLSGVMQAPRSPGEVSCELPRQAESWEQAVAWVTWALDNHVGGIFQPTSPVTWLEQGRSYIHMLPWERARAAYKARPHCGVHCDWARVALRKLAEEIDRADSDTRVTLRFDGEVLKIWCADVLIAVPASGAPWAIGYSLGARTLRRLPKRLTTQMVEFSIWDSALTIGNWRYSGALALDG